MIFQKLLTSGKIILIATIAFCTVSSENDTASMENHTASTENDTDKTANDTAVSYQSYYIKPLHYNAAIRFNYETSDIIGECNITIHIDHQTENIIVEAVTFAIFKIALYDNRNEKNYIPRYSFDNDLSKLIIDFTNTSKLLPPGQYNLIMAYMRYMNNNKKHFFEFLHLKSDLDMLNATGIDIMLARQLFPIVCSTILCGGEENLNATFKISIKHHKNYTALSNMSIKRKDRNDAMWTHFDISPIMSLKHLTVVITTFTSISFLEKDFKIWGRESVIHYLQLAKCIGEQVLYYLKHENENKTRVAKIDYIAFWDSYHNISETQGLILHRETNIVYDEDLNSLRYKMQVSYLITYEIVSFWYADALLWSKTGFVSLLSTHILYQIASIYDIINLFITTTQLESFRYGTPASIKRENELSHFLNYTKSLSAWRMLYQIIPNNTVFWIGIHTYINQQYNRTNAMNTDNIGQTILRAYNPDSLTAFIVTNLTSTWTTERYYYNDTKYYYPILYVTRNFETKSTTFSYYIPDDIDNDHFDPIFVTYTTKSVMQFHEIFNNKSFWLSPSTKKQQQEEFEANDWIIVNLEQRGYYRVYYDSDNWLKLAQYMNSTNYIFISTLNRAQLVDDAFHALISQEIDYAVFWKIVAFLSLDMNYVVWYPMLKIFEYIVLLVSIENAEDIKNHMETLLSGVLQIVGYTETQYESDLTQSLREEVVKWACIIGNKNCRKNADDEMTKDLERAKSDTVKQPQRRQWIYCNSLKIADERKWRKIWEKWLSTSDNKFLEYLTCNEDPKIISEYLRLTIESEFLTKVQPNNTRAYIFLLIIAKHIKHNNIYETVSKNLNTYILSFGSNKQTVKIAILIVIMSHQRDVNQLAKVVEFAKTNLKEMRLVNAFTRKEKKRKLEVGKQVSNYGSGLVIERR